MITNNQWILKELWDFEEEVPEGAMRSYAKLLLVCTKGDAVIEEREKRWVLGYCRALGASEALIEELAQYDGSEAASELVAENPGLAAGHVRPLIYDAVKACSSDGTYADAERRVVLRLAESLGISAEVVGEIEGLINDEEQLKARRIQTVYPSGAPF